jgi:ABC-type glycerol-3-phosphate transport system substrate-binding protein
MTTTLDRRAFNSGSPASQGLSGSTLGAAAQPVPSGKVTVEMFALVTNGFEPVIDAFQKEYPNITSS